MKVDDITKLLSKVDPARVQALFPAPNDQERFESARRIVLVIVESVRTGSLDASCFDQIDSAAAEFRALYGRLSPSTEIASRSVLNEAVLWAEVGHLERSIFLAGVARERKVKEPYRSQLNSLPANACCSRYRQISILVNTIRERIDETSFREIFPLFNEIRRSYLTQFVYFAGQASLDNREHPLVAYMQTVACLMKAFELEIAGRTVEAEAIAKTGYQAAQAIKEPNKSTHFMELQYHRMNLAEFLEMRRLSTRHSDVAARLRHLADKAEHFRNEHLGRRPAMSYAFAPIVGWGARSASVVGLLLSAAPLLGWDQATIHASIDALWVQVADQIPQFADHVGGMLSPIYPQMSDMSAHTGGFATLASSHTGGIGAQLAALATHTGGFA